jgi:hypothetical protein
MAGLYLVIRTRGDTWDAELQLEEQAEWPAHAAFMNALAVKQERSRARRAPSLAVATP